MFHALQSGEKLLMTKGEQEICPVHIDDVTDALLATLNSNQENFFSHFDIHGPDKLQLKELLHIMESVSGRKWKTDQVQMSLPNREREIYFVNPKFGLPPYWQPKIDISEGLKTLMDENN
jgi:nucleoside-diphosphate-sugar epimerase